MSWLFGGSSASAPAGDSGSSVAAPEEKLDALEAGAVDTDKQRDISKRGSSHFRMPDMKPELVKKTDFIPAQLAADKMADAMAAYDETKTAFEARIVTLNAHHAATRSKREEFYAEQVAELRSKARRHVEVQRTLRQQSEDKLNSQLGERDNTIEDLRDNLADLRTDNKQKERRIKQQGQTLQQREHSLRVVRATPPYLLSSLVSAMICYVCRALLISAPSSSLSLPLPLPPYALCTPCFAVSVH